MAALGTNDLQITIKAVDLASKDLDSVKTSITHLGNEAKKSSGFMSAMGGAVSKAANVAKIAFVAATAAMTAGGIAAAKASWDQVSAVEQATVALRAYEKDGNKVNDVLSQLIAYARSDMGVLFNRKDLFAAAQGLKMMGDNTDQLTEHVKIMSRSVGLGLSTWDELTQIIGRVGSTSQLTGDDFDNLTKAGFKLDPALRNTKITFDQLFKVLEKGIPADAMAGQANTIEGLGIRFQTAFRGIGDAILGVDADTSRFVEGGLGDRLMKAWGDAVQKLKELKPVVSDAVKNILGAFDLMATGDFKDGMFASWVKEDSKFIDVLLGVRDTAIRVFNYLLPAFQFVSNVVKNDLFPAMKRFYDEVLVPMAPLFGTVLVGAIYAAIIAVGLIAKAIGFLFDVATNVFKFFTETLPAALGTAFDWIGDKANWLKDHFWEVVGFIIGFFATLPIKLPLLVYQAIGAIIDWLTRINWGEVFGAIGRAFEGVWNWVKDSAKKAWEFISNINWGAVLTGIGRGLGNAIIGLIEGAINGALSGLPGSPKVSLPRFARGTNYAPGGLALVGEEGPELVNLPRGSQIKTASQTRQALSQAQSGSPVTINQYINNNMDMSRAIAEIGFALRAKA